MRTKEIVCFTRYHLPFDPQYDSIIIGNVDGECYVNTVAEAEAKGFRRVGYVLVVHLRSGVTSAWVELVAFCISNP